MRQPLAIPPGIFPDDTTFEVAGRWKDASLVRFHRGQAEMVGGWEDALGTTLTGVCRGLHTWTDNSPQLNIAFGTHQKLEVYVGGLLVDITPTSRFTAGQIDGTGGAGYGTGAYSVGTYSAPSAADFFPLTWSLGTYGQSLMANPRGQTIFWWQNNTGTPAAALTNAPAKVTCMLVAKTRQVMAFGCNEEVSGTFNPLCLRFSDIEDPTDWTTTVTNNAGEIILEGGGRIVGAQAIGDNILVWTDNALYLGTFTGDQNDPWSFPCVAEHCGLAGPNAAAIVGQTAYWFSRDGQFRAYALGGEPQVMDSPVQASLFANLAPAQSDKIFAASVSAFNEVWWFYPDARDGGGLENSRYVSLGVVDGSWSRGILARTAYTDAGAAPYPVAVDPTGLAYYQEKGNSANGGPIDGFIESADQYLSPDQVQMIRGVWPDFQAQQGIVKITVSTRFYPQDTPVAFGPFISPIGTEKLDFRTSGRMANIKIEANSAPCFFRLGAPAFDVVPAGGR